VSESWYGCFNTAPNDVSEAVLVGGGLSKCLVRFKDFLVREESCSCAGRSVIGVQYEVKSFSFST